MTGVAGILVLFGLLLFSVNERSQRLQRMYRGKGNANQELPAHGSPFAESITQTVGIAGGIYLAIITTINFLKIEMPETFNLWGLSLDPIAMASFVITILQPFVLLIKDKFLR